MTFVGYLWFDLIVICFSPQDQFPLWNSLMKNHYYSTWGKKILSQVSIKLMLFPSILLDSRSVADKDLTKFVKIVSHEPLMTDNELFILSFFFLLHLALFFLISNTRLASYYCTFTIIANAPRPSDESRWEAVVSVVFTASYCLYINCSNRSGYRA